MHSTAKRIRPWRALGVVAAASLALGVAGAQTAYGDSENTRNIRQTAAELVGEANGSGATSGPAVTFDGAIDNQNNVQVIAGDEETRENSSQTATNEANVDQDNTAVSGGTSASDGATARSGAAVAGSLAIVQQLNVQVIAGRGCEVTQEASNLADVDQTGAAASGGAEASGEGSSARSGNARAMNVGVVQQRNIQVYVCRDGSTGEQVASNVGGMEQTTAAASGTASAEDGGTAATGNTSATSRDRLQQDNFQRSID